MPDNGVCAIPAGSPPAKHIILINTDKPWGELVTESLATCDKNQWSSIAFPALGTGMVFN